MFYSRYCEYVIRALSYLSQYQQENKFIMAREVSDKTGIPYHFLSKIFQDLTTTKWVQSKKGKNGGFTLAVDSGSLTLLEIIKWSDGIHNFNQCVLGDKICGEDFECSVHRKCCRLRLEIEDFFEKMTIREFSEIRNETLGQKQVVLN